MLASITIATVGEAGIQQCATGFTTTVCPGSLLTLAFSVSLLFGGSFLVTLGLTHRRETRTASGQAAEFTRSMARIYTASRFMTIAGVGLVSLGLTTQFVAPYFSCFQVRGGVCGANLPSGWLPFPLGILVSGLIVLFVGVVVGATTSRRQDRPSLSG